MMDVREEDEDYQNPVDQIFERRGQQRDSLSEIGRKYTGTIYRDIEASRMFVEHCSAKDVGDLQRKRRIST